MLSFWEYMEAITMQSGEKVRHADMTKALRQYDQPWTFVSYQKLPKVGINPQYSWAFSPSAIYAYSVSHAAYRYINFGSDYPSMVIFKVKDEAKPYILDLKTLEKDFESVYYDPYASEEVNKNFIIKTYQKLMPQLPGFVDAALKYVTYLFERVMSPVEVIYTIMQKMTGNAMRIRKALASLGIRGYLAGETSVAKISNECVFFYPTDLVVLDRFSNQEGLMGFAHDGNPKVNRLNSLTTVHSKLFDAMSDLVYNHDTSKLDQILTWAEILIRNKKDLRTGGEAPKIIKLLLQSEADPIKKEKLNKLYNLIISPKYTR